MPDAIFEDQTYLKLDLLVDTLQKGQYDNCRFSSCQMSMANLSGFLFVDCEFNQCDISNANISNTVFRDVHFTNCKMLGLRFDTCNSFGLAFSFEGCNLSYTSFFNTRIKKTLFRNTVLIGCDLVKADLSGVMFEKCNLDDAKFENTILAKADFRSAINYAIDPEINQVSKAKFGLSGLSGLLKKYDIEIDPAC